MTKRKSASRKAKTSVEKRKLRIFGQLVSRTELPNELQIPTPVLNQIIIAARVPNKHRLAVRAEVESVVVERMVSQRSTSEINQLKEIRAPFKHIAKQAERLLKSVQQLEPGLRAWFTASLTMEEDNEFMERGQFWRAIAKSW